MLKFLLYIYHGRLALMGFYASLTARHLTYIYLARSANLPEGLCILPSVISSFFPFLL